MDFSLPISAVSIKPSQTFLAVMLTAKYFWYSGGPKVYDVTNYLDDHPGGAEVMLDVAGQDADEFFEDIGHSKEAREELAKHYIGDFHLTEAAKAKLKAQQEAQKSSVQKSPATTILVVLVAIAAILYAVYSGQGSGEAVPPPAPEGSE